MQHDFFSHLALLALASASHDANGIVKRPIIFIRSRQLKQCETELFGHVLPLMLASVSHDANSLINGIIPFLGQDHQKQMLHTHTHNFLVMCCHWH